MAEDYFVQHVPNYHRSGKWCKSGASWTCYRLCKSSDWEKRFFAFFFPNDSVFKSGTNCSGCNITLVDYYRGIKSVKMYISVSSRRYRAFNRWNIELTKSKGLQHATVWRRGKIILVLDVFGFEFPEKMIRLDPDHAGFTYVQYFSSTLQLNNFHTVLNCVCLWCAVDDKSNQDFRYDSSTFGII